MIRIAKIDDVEPINAIRKEVSLIHSKNEDKIFKNDFSDELRNYIFEFFNSDEKKVIVYELDGNVVCYAMVEFIIKPETPYRYELKFADIVEFGVKQEFRGKGIGKELIEFIKDLVKQNGFYEIRLDAWNFNSGAINFYKKNGFEDYRTLFRMFLK